MIIIAVNKQKTYLTTKLFLNLPAQYLHNSAQFILILFNATERILSENIHTVIMASFARVSLLRGT